MTDEIAHSGTDKYKYKIKTQPNKLRQKHKLSHVKKTQTMPAAKQFSINQEHDQLGHFCTQYHKIVTTVAV